MILNSQLLLDEPVRQVVADSYEVATGNFARTDFALYRAENYGLTWLTVDNLLSSPTALAVANTIGYLLRPVRRIAACSPARTDEA